MAGKREPSYADLVHEVLAAADQPLTMQELLERVNARRPVTSRDPSATLRSALGQARQLVSVGDGRYGYMPKLSSGSLLRLPLVGRRPANQPLTFPIDVIVALWPDWLDIDKRKLARSVRLRLPGGN